MHIDLWPHVTIILVVRDEERRLGDVLGALTASDYPAGRRRIVVVSEASGDRTDAIAREHAEDGVELVRLDEPRGRTAAEDAVVDRIEGDIVVNTTPSVCVDRGALKALVRALADPRVGVASGTEATPGGGRGPLSLRFERMLRGLENAAGGGVEVSESLYAIRRGLHVTPLPRHLDRAAVAPLVAEELGYRTVSVPDARYVPWSGPGAQWADRRRGALQTSNAPQD